MEGPGKLNDMFESYTIDSNDSQLQWSEMGQKINDALPPVEEKKKRRFIWWWLSGLGVVLAILFFGWDALQSPDSISSSTEVTASANPVAADREDIVVPKSDAVEKESLVTQSESKTSIKNRRNSEHNSNNSMNIKKSGVAGFNNYTIEAVEIIKENINNKVDVESEIDNLFSVDDDDEIVNLNSNLQFDSATSARNILSDVKRLELLPIDALVVDNDIATIEGKYIQSPNDEKTINQLNKSVYLYSGIELSNIADQYQNASALLGSSIEAGINIPLRNNFFLSTGLRYQQHRFQTDFIQSEAIQIFRPESIDTIFNYGSDYQVLVFTDFVDGVGTRSFGYTNTINTLSLPVEIGYSFNFGKIKVAPQLGLALMLNQQSTLRTANEFFDIESVDATDSWSMFPLVRGGVSVQVPVMSRLNLAVRYNFSGQTLYSATGSDRSNYISHGVQVGFHFDL